MKTITLELFNHGEWRPAAEVSFHGNEMSSGVTLSYMHNYIRTGLGPDAYDATTQYEAINSMACSINAPITIVPIDYPNWPALFDDVLPVGKARDWWFNFLDVSRSTIFEQQYVLLTQACMAPVGNLRVKEAALNLPKVSSQRFNIGDVAKLQYNFLEYAIENGAAIGGATGAGGVAPKLLLMVDGQEVYIDGDFAGKPVSAIPYLVKFARNNRSPRDNNILKAEGVFYHALNELLRDTEIQTINAEHMMTLEHQSQVSLWLPRFDVELVNGVAHRLGLESIYSIINAGPGSYQNHFSVIETVWHKLHNATSMSSDEFIKQYLARDMLNIVFGNSDNHGRNISFLKSASDIWFAPIYDFAPMKADPEGVTRLFKWGDGFELAGEVNYKKIVAELADYCEPKEALQFLNDLGKKLLDLPTLLKQLGCPDEILNFPTIGFANTESKLIKMGVLDA